MSTRSNFRRAFLCRSMKNYSHQITYSYTQRLSLGGDWCCLKSPCQNWRNQLLVESESAFTVSWVGGRGAFQEALWDFCVDVRRCFSLSFEKDCLWLAFEEPEITRIFVKIVKSGRFDAGRCCRSVDSISMACREAVRVDEGVRLVESCPVWAVGLSGSRSAVDSQLIRKLECCLVEGVGWCFAGSECCWSARQSTTILFL